MNKITIKQYQDSYLQDIIKLTSHSISTNRSIHTWCGNDMTAVLAFDGDCLIGVIPLEKRSFYLGDAQNINLLWVSGAHVDENYINQGIGTAMDQKIKDFYFPEFKGVFVYRQDETSPAFKWYKKIGYHELLTILAFKKNISPPVTAENYIVLQNEEQLGQWEDKIYACFMNNSKTFGGFPQRHPRFWSNKLKTHYYKDFYKYKFLLLTRNGEVSTYAFLGQTNMKDRIERFDILEIITLDNEEICNALYRSLNHLAYKQRVKEIRIQLSTQDPNLKWIKSLGFVNRWRTNILGKLFDPVKYFKDYLTNKIDLERDYQFIMQTPSLGKHCIGKGKFSITLFSDDALFTKMLLGRCKISNAVEEKRLLVVNGNEDNISVLEECFLPNKWRYYQIDYI